jgi:hypothetical protein
MEVVWTFDPDLIRQLEHIREMIALQHQTPSREWPLGLGESERELFVVREWPNGSITAYTTTLPEAAK